MSPQFDSMTLPPRLPLAVVPANRSGTATKDGRLVNCYLETDKQGELFIIKRAGLLNSGDLGAGNGRGIFYWNSDRYAVFGTTLYRNNVSVGTGLDGTGGVYRFSAILGATPKLILGNGVKTYAYTVAGGLTADLHTLDVDFPATCVKGICYLNGATYVMQPQAVIWGSTVNDVLAGAWDPLDYISAQIEPDNGVYLAKQLTYLIAFNEWSAEVFFDAGNPTGSPLGNVQGSKSGYGCAHQDSVQQIGDSLLWISATRSGTVQVAMMEALSVKIASTDAIDRILNGSALQTVYSLQLRSGGHTFYILTLKEQNITLVYDLTEDAWHQWTDTAGNYFPFVASSYDSSKRNLFQHETNGKIYYVSDSYYTDDSSVITVDIYTPNFDASTKRKKQLSQLEVIADQTAGSVLQLRRSDDDYQTWTNFRKLDLNQIHPVLPNCGTFRKRAYHLRHQCNTPFRIQALEVQYDIGTL